MVVTFDFIFLEKPSPTRPSGSGWQSWAVRFDTFILRALYIET
jgi:hypothetical protein